MLILASRSPRRSELLAAAGISFEVLAADVDETPHPNEAPDARIATLEHMLDEVGTSYRPECLHDCGMSRLCRARAQLVGTPTMCGSSIVRVLPGIRTLGRAAELASGAHPSQPEHFAAQALRTADAIYKRVLNTGAL